MHLIQKLCANKWTRKTVELQNGVELVNDIELIFAPNKRQNDKTMPITQRAQIVVHKVSFKSQKRV